jgi:hypothetical protein
MDWNCSCGSVQLKLRTRVGTRIVCYCPSCRDFLQRCDRAGWLDPWGGSDLYQTAPENVTIGRGKDKLGWIRLSAKGPLRWVATCCNTPVANTLESRTVPYLTLQTRGIDDPADLGEVAARANRRYATGHITEPQGSVNRVIWTFGARALRSWATGGWRKNPFFDVNGAPIGDRTNLPKPKVRN